MVQPITLTVKPTSFIILLSVLSLPSLAFNMIFVSELTKNLSCFISFFPVYCLFQHLMAKQTIGKGHVSDGLFILDTWVPRLVACSSVVLPFESHCQLGYPSLIFEEVNAPGFMMYLW